VSTYRDEVEIGTLNELCFVTVGTWGREDELGMSETCEPWPVRLRVQDDDEQATAEAYMSIVEATEVVAALNNAIARARGYPQPAKAQV
jgi:hypothetical protein